MPTVTFKGENKSCQVERASKIMIACDRVGSNIPFGCRRGVCGTCIIDVVEGLENIAPADIQEESTRQEIGALPHQRMACQARVRGNITIHAA